jgi:hypothetical protein
MKTPLDTRGSRANDGGSARLGKKQPDGTHAHRIAHSGHADFQPAEPWGVRVPGHISRVGIPHMVPPCGQGAQCVAGLCGTRGGPAALNRRSRTIGLRAPLAKAVALANLAISWIKRRRVRRGSGFSGWLSSRTAAATG